MYLCKVVTRTMMKRIALFLILFSLAFNAMADGAWTVRTVPNTRLQSNDIHVSDPDGYLSDSVEMTINMALCAIRDKADVFVVTLSSIGEAEPKRFATELFNDWGIGDAETDNGVLLLFVEDQHALEFETGYGAEETLTDSKCERIFTKTIKPFFKKGDYEGGLCAGVADIVTVFGGEIPLGLKTILPSQTDNDSDDDFDKVGSSLWLGVFGLFLFAMPIVGIVFWLRKRKERKKTVSSAYQSYNENGVTFVDGFSTNWSGSPWEGKGCLGGMMLGLSMFVIMFFVLLFRFVPYTPAETMEEKRERLNKNKSLPRKERIRRPKNRTWKQELPGAIVSSALWIIFTRLFSIYVKYRLNHPSYYGSLASVFLSLLWLYFCIMFIFIGALYNNYGYETGESATRHLVRDLPDFFKWIKATVFKKSKPVKKG